jgi:hypothetical protein
LAPGERSIASPLPAVCERGASRPTEP